MRQLEAPSSPGGFRTPAVERKLVLLANLDAETRGKLEPAFHRVEFEVSRAPTLRLARRLVQSSRFDLIVIGFSRRLEELDQLLGSIRRLDSPNVATRVALLAAPDDLAFARLSGDRGAAKSIGLALGPLELQDAVLGLLRERARLSPRAVIRVSVRLGGAGEAQLLCQTRDLSRTGLFVITQGRYPIGSAALLTLDLPDGGGGLRCEAEVVRQAGGARERAEGIGLRFVRFAADGERRLAAFLDRQLS